MQVGGEDVALNHPVEAVPVAVSRALTMAARVSPQGREPYRRGGFRSRSAVGSGRLPKVDTTSPMVRSACGEVVTSSSPTPSTRSPAEVSYQWPST